jgi:hypothetical protein
MAVRPEHPNVHRHGVGIAEQRETEGFDFGAG